MLGDGAEAPTATPMLDRLRAATAASHAALEARLALMTRPLDRDRFVQALQVFEAFHRAWEPRAAAWLGETASPRSRLALAEADLARLRAAPAPLAFDLGFLSDRASAWGSAYVVEGSALGGQLISKALWEADWAPDAGLSYFNPYGRETGAMWKAFRQAMERETAALDPDRVVEGARCTFDALREAVPAPLGGVA